MRLKKPLKILGIAAVIVIVCFFAFRATLLRYAFNKAKLTLKENYHITLNTEKLSFSGIDHISISNLTLQPENADTLITAKSVEINLSLLNLLTGTLAFDGINMDSALIDIHNQRNDDNISFLKQKGKQQPSANPSSVVSYHKSATAIKSKLLRLLNTPFNITNVQLLYRDSLLSENLFLPELKNTLQHISGLVVNQNLNDTLLLSVNVLKKNKDYLFSIEHLSNNLCYLPFFEREGGLRCRFKSITTHVKFDTYGSELQVATDINADDFQMQHWRLATENVIIPKAGFKGTFKISDDVIELDSSSILQSGNMPLNIFIQYQRKPESVFTINMQMPETVADTFFRSLPSGMFNTLTGISCSGTLAYDLHFKLDINAPDSLEFESTLKRKNLRINRYGQENYTRINESFTHAVYDKDRLVRQIIVGPENPMFTPLSQISPYLPRCIMQSEDPSFMNHRGFIAEAFRESIAQNYKEKRFARGGSTISMQLVKNVFLNRNKTVSRKVEEALIVYLIENLGLVSKERMLEVYLNIIEWGPNIYGIGEASRFYFNKRPAELNLQESIFLAAIVPNPKYFRYQFDRAGHLKPYLADYFRVLTGRMASKGWITTSDTIGMLPDVKLSGPALRLVVPDTITAPLDLNLRIEQ